MDYIDREKQVEEAIFMGDSLRRPFGNTDLAAGPRALPHRVRGFNSPATAAGCVNKPANVVSWATAHFQHARSPSERTERAQLGDHLLARPAIASVRTSYGVIIKCHGVSSKPESFFPRWIICYVHAAKQDGFLSTGELIAHLALEAQDHARRAKSLCVAAKIAGGHE
jgi:hypothetical protein